MYISKENKKSHISHTYKVGEVARGEKWAEGEGGMKGGQEGLGR